MLQWILQHHLRENVLKFGLCAEAAVLLLEMVRFTVDKVGVSLQGQCSVSGWIKSPGVTDAGGSLCLWSLVLLCPQRATLNCQGAQQLLPWLCSTGCDGFMFERDQRQILPTSVLSFFILDDDMSPFWLGVSSVCNVGVGYWCLIWLLWLCHVCLGIPKEEQRWAFMNERNAALTRCTFVCSAYCRCRSLLGDCLSKECCWVSELDLSQLYTGPHVALSWLLENSGYACFSFRTTQGMCTGGSHKPFRPEVGPLEKKKSVYSRLSEIVLLSAFTGWVWRPFDSWWSCHCRRERLCWSLLSPTLTTPRQETSVGFCASPYDGQSSQHPSKQTRTSPWAASWGLSHQQALLFYLALGVEGRDISF